MSFDSVLNIEQLFHHVRSTERRGEHESLCWGDIMKTAALTSATLDHRTGATLFGAPASRFHRVERPASSGPNYAARRLGALFLAISAVFAGVWMVEQAAASLGGAPVVAAEPVNASLVGDSIERVHVARDGDSLWSIADDYRGDVDRDRYVDALVALNGGTTVSVGQGVRLP